MTSDRWLSPLAAVLIAGCAAQGQSIGEAPASTLSPAGAASVPAAASGYKLTETELKLDCSKLTGIMRVRIANMRANYVERSGTNVSRTLQSVVTPVYGGTRRGADPVADLQLDRAKLEAYNRRLAEKKCKTLDIDAELKEEAAPSAKSTPGQ